MTLHKTRLSKAKNLLLATGSSVAAVARRARSPCVSMMRRAGRFIEHGAENICQGSGVAMVGAVAVGLTLGFPVTQWINASLASGLDQAFRPSVGRATYARVPGTDDLVYTERLSVRRENRPVGERVRTGRDNDVLASAELIIYKDVSSGSRNTTAATPTPLFAVQMNDELLGPQDMTSRDRALLIDMAVWTLDGDQMLIEQWWINEGSDSNQIVRQSEDGWGYQVFDRDLDTETVTGFLKHKAADFITSGDEKLRVTTNMYDNEMADFLSARVTRALSTVGQASQSGVAMAIIGGPFQAVIVGVAIGAYILLLVPLLAYPFRRFHARIDALWTDSTSTDVVRAKLGLTNACALLGLMGTIYALCVGLSTGQPPVKVISFGLGTTLLATVPSTFTALFGVILTRSFRTPPSKTAPRRDPVDVATMTMIKDTDGDNGIAALAESGDVNEINTGGSTAPTTAYKVVRATDADYAIAQTSTRELGQRTGLTLHQVRSGVRLLEQRGVANRVGLKGSRGTVFELLVGRPDGSEPSLNGQLKGERASAPAHRIHDELRLIAQEQDWRRTPHRQTAEVLGIPVAAAKRELTRLEQAGDIEVFRPEMKGATTRARLVPYSNIGSSA